MKTTSKKLKLETLPKIITQKIKLEILSNKTA
jgi:hypothetical protein